MNKLKKILVVTFAFVVAFSAGAEWGNGIPDKVYADMTVYVTPTGSKYHSHKCGRGSYSPTTLSAAQAMGLGPCSKCYGSNPPSSATSSNSSRSTTSSKPNIQLNKKSMTLIVGKTKRLKVKGASSGIQWKSSDKKIASVDSKGKVKAKAKGKTKITATVKGKSLTCKVKVESPVLSDTALTMYEGEEAYLELKGCQHEAEWYVDDEEIAEIEDGDLYAYGEGVTTVYAIVHGKTFTCVVTVLPDPDNIEDPTTSFIYE